MGSVKRISLLKVPIDILPPGDEFEETIKSIFSDDKNHQIVLLSLWDLMRARRNPEFRTMVAGARLVIPISASIIKAARFLKKPLPVRYMPFDFAVKTMNVLERWNKTVYLLGGTARILQRAEKNLKATFPGVRIVGRYSGWFRKGSEPKIIEAIRKASPTLLLAGKGVPGGERWIPRSMKYFNSGIFMWCSDLLDVFAEKKRRPARDIFEQGMEWLPHLFSHPWKIYRILPFMYFKLLLLLYRIRGK
jgi:N-acetylglucosaminyldiphosphoundecaprenol N-acetyl-beta-D-mannosaminyltransferase